VNAAASLFWLAQVAGCAWEAEASSVPLTASCGLQPARGLRPGEFRTVRCADAAGVAVPGVLVGRRGHAVLRVLAPPGPAGRRVVRTVDGPPPAFDAVRAGVASDGSLAVAAAGATLRAEIDGALRFDGGEARLHGAGVFDGAWRLVEADPLRALVVWEGAFRADADPRGAWRASLAVAVDAAGRVVLQGTVERTVGRGAPCDLGLAILPEVDPESEAPSWSARFDAATLDGDEADAERAARRRRPRTEPWEEPTFEAFVAGLLRPELRDLGRVGARAAAVPVAIPTSPRALRRTASGGVVVVAVVRGEPFDRGEARGFDVVLDPGPVAGAPPPAVVPLALPRRLPGGAHVGRPSADQGLAAIEATAADALRAWRSDPRRGLGHRARDAGDWRMDASSDGNLEWDTALGLGLRFLDRGDPRDLRQAVCGAAHLALVDRDAARSGLFFQHGLDHRSEVVEAGHHWVEGLRLVADLLDDPRTQALLPRLATDQTRTLAGVDLAVAPTRSVGWGLRALAALHDLAPDRGASAAQIRRFRAAALAAATASGHLGVEPESIPGGLRRVSPFVAGGVLLPALTRADEATEERAARRAVATAAAALRRDAFERVDGRDVFRASLFLDARRGRLARRSGEGSGEELLLFLAGLAEAAGAVPADRARLETALATLRLPTKRHLGKELSMALRALPALAR